VAAGYTLKPIGGGFAGLARRVPNATVAALNRVAASARASAAKTIGADLGIKQAAVRAAVIVQKASVSTMESLVIARGKRIPLYELGARKVARGVSYKSASGRKTIAGAFVATMENRHTGIFRRIGPKRPNRKGNYIGQMRQKIIELFGPSVVLPFVKRPVQSAMREVIRTRMPIEMAAAAKFFAK